MLSLPRIDAINLCITYSTVLYIINLAAGSMADETNAVLLLRCASNTYGAVEHYTHLIAYQYSTLEDYLAHKDYQYAGTNILECTNCFYFK